jgi:hypothetical protein
MSYYMYFKSIINLKVLALQLLGFIPYYTYKRSKADKALTDAYDSQFTTYQALQTVIRRVFILSIKVSLLHLKVVLISVDLP